jgi:hypothetical protein
LVIDLCCGLGGRTKGFLAEGYDAVGFDVERHVYGEKRYPGQLILRDVLTLNGYELRAANPSVIVASPPCQRYSRMALPFSGGKREAAWQRWERDSPFGDFALNDLFDACFRIARECGVPIVLENVKGAQPWVGQAAAHFGPYYLWGDVPPLLPVAVGANKGKGSGRSWFEDNRAPIRYKSSKSSERKAWSAEIAEVPFDLAQWIARCFHP